MIAAVHGRHRVRRQGQPSALQPLLQPRFRILERRRVGQAREFLGKHEIDDSFCRRRAAVKQYGAQQRFDSVGQTRPSAARRLNAARRHRASNARRCQAVGR